MMHRVVKPFPFSDDGFTLVDLNVGDERDFGAHAGGLLAEGWVEDVGEVGKSVEPAEKPAEKPAKRTK